MKDPYFVLSLLLDRDVFGDHLGHVGRRCVHEARDYRNEWAHNEPLTLDDTFRAVDSLERILKLLGAQPSTELSNVKRAVCLDMVAD